MEQDFILSLLVIIGIDIVLGGDNAIVIAMACRNLPSKERNKAIFLGTLIAIVLRIIITMIAVYLLKIPFLQLIGGIFLLYIAYQLIVSKDHDTGKIKSHPSFRKAIQTIVFADVLMGFDNVIAIAGAANGRTILVVIGLIISIPIIIWGSKFILVLLERYPALIYAGGGLLAFTAGKMIISEQQFESFLMAQPVIAQFLPYLTTIFIIFASIFYQQILGWRSNN
ncbi:TerC family protein [Metabacillus fastidiosus]|uniref:TerC family protein n=1 Tax=Metabacillus fastidiosus TaxID=1458 RepID=A0ABU6P1F2_9BACI|nr:TerC family protein [Metabacillus fastidiosus]MED4403193.1 TerC family protein [Metabacillus fastidiosus]MED4455426.1 TerC family protein [Metabacillus fastidiosus]MED4461617.1 TerC family protein [Metabacillus fastidiosus]